MNNLPNPSVPLVGPDGRPSSSLLSIMPKLSAVDVVVDSHGAPTLLFLNRLREVAAPPLPGARAQMVNADGTPTRVFSALLAGMK